VSRLRLAARLALASLLGFAMRLSGRRAGLALVYHEVAERNGDPGRELVPPHALELFEAQVRHVARRYRLVRAEDLPAAVAARRRGERFPAAITFDDDLVAHAALAAPALRRLGVPATFFLTGASLDRPFAFWWQRLQQAADLGLDLPVEGDGIHEAAARLEGMSPADRDAIAARLEDAPAEPGLPRERVRELAAAGFDIGFHTLRHDRLTDLDDEALARAFTDGRAELEDAAGRPFTAIAYPHGKADERVARAAAAAGFRLGFTGRYEAVEPSSDLLLLGRIEPSFGPAANFAVQLVGALRPRRHR
jgi:peptidoglycan/xylan/chitin deacetylase (PgdA/CDA1 family)